MITRIRRKFNTQRTIAMYKFLFVVLFTTNVSFAEAQSEYTPTPENLTARKQFQDNKFGMFIHWGASSVLGAGEWVMNNRNIKVDEYTRLVQIFNPQNFDAAKWVGIAKAAGYEIYHIYYPSS
jgi:alpha-L-fucosidase